MYYAGLEGHLVTLTSQAEDTFVGTLAQNTQLPGRVKFGLAAIKTPPTSKLQGTVGLG